MKALAWRRQRALGERAVAGFVLGAMGDPVPDEALPADRLAADADHPEARRLEKADDGVPAGRVGPVLALRRALHADADIRLGDRRRVVGQDQTRRRFGRIDAEDVARRAVQVDLAEIRGLGAVLGIVEEQAETVGGIGTRGEVLLTNASCVTKRISGCAGRSSAISGAAMTQVSRQKCAAANFTA